MICQKKIRESARQLFLAIIARGIDKLTEHWGAESVPRAVASVALEVGLLAVAMLATARGTDEGAISMRVNRQYPMSSRQCGGFYEVRRENLEKRGG